MNNVKKNKFVLELHDKPSYKLYNACIRHIEIAAVHCVDCLKCGMF